MTYEVSAASLTHFQGCKRRHLLDWDWTPRRWRPKALFDAILRKAILRLSGGAEALPVIEWAKATLMKIATDPGMDIYGQDPYKIAMDFCAMYETILRTLARQTLLVMKEIPPKCVNSMISWRFNSWDDESGTLHRWITCDGFDEADQWREVHSWYSMGDIAVSQRPMQIHMIKIGQIRNGRRASLWCRGWKNPHLPNMKMHFMGRDGKAPKGWNPVYLADDKRLDPEEWVETMHRERAIETLTKIISLDVPTEQACAHTQGQIILEAMAMHEMVVERQSSPWSSYPMSRGACDFPIPCPYQFACYTEKHVDLEELGLYDRRTSSGTDHEVEEEGPRSMPLAVLPTNGN